MGQGQEAHARRLLADAMAAGRWLLLQNCHLSLDFCQEMLDTVTESDNVNRSFRLWITTEVHAAFPIGLLQVLPCEMGQAAVIRKSYYLRILYL